MATVEDRLTAVEDTQRILAEVDSRQQRFIEQNALRVDQHEQRMAEIREDGRKTRRLIILIAKKAQWLSDDDIDADE